MWGCWLRATGGQEGAGRGDEVKGRGWSRALGAPLAFPEDRSVLTANSRACSSTWGREGGSQGLPGR